MDNLFILGASDPEMAAIQSLLDASGVEYAFAAVGGKRCHPGNAYKADSLVGEGMSTVTATAGTVVAVECDGPLLARAESRGRSVVRCDHHRPGDAGFGVGPADFIDASSIGQVVLALSRSEGLDNLGWEPAIRDGNVGSQEDMPILSATTGKWCVWEYSDPRADDARGWVIPHEIVLAAAGDHCPGAAYRGECPGVDAEALMRWRAQSRADFQKREVESVLDDARHAVLVLMDSLHGYCLRGEGCCSAPHYDDRHKSAIVIGGHEVADLRGRNVPELPEAALRLGVAYIATVTEPTGRVKVVLGGSAPNQAEIVTAFLAGAIPGLKEMYGDPARGFAGGYLPEEMPDKCSGCGVGGGPCPNCGI